MNSGRDYQKVVNSLKKRSKGATAADICAATALPLSTVRDILPKAADEYSGHLRVTESGEILYYFPSGFTSRYRGPASSINRFILKVAGGVKAVSTFLFKAWIMIMLIGYFLLFMALALASVVLASAGDNRGRRSSSSSFGLFNIIWRLWFFSEITKPRYGNARNVNYQYQQKKHPMHKAIFSFVFGEEDPNKNFSEKQDRAIILYIQENNGVISLPEFMAFTGSNSMEAGQNILSFCSKYNGSPEVTDEGTIVYRFDELLSGAGKGKISELSPLLKKLRIFSNNKKSMNNWFVVINAVNLIFGSYFLYQANTQGHLITEIQYQTSSYFYAFTHALFSQFVNNPHNFIWAVLGLIPILFSVFFWLIPAVRFFLENNENSKIKLSNFKRFGFSKIWASPKNIDIEKLQPFEAKEHYPEDAAAAGDRVIKDFGAVFVPDVVIDQAGKTVYSFPELEKEKQALEKYRASINPENSQMGKTIFDSQK